MLPLLRPPSFCPCHILLSCAKWSLNTQGSKLPEIKKTGAKTQPRPNLGIRVLAPRACMSEGCCLELPVASVASGNQSDESTRREEGVQLSQSRRRDRGRTIKQEDECTPTPAKEALRGRERDRTVLHGIPFSLTGLFVCRGASGNGAEHDKHRHKYHQNRWRALKVLREEVKLPNEKIKEGLKGITVQKLWENLREIRRTGRFKAGALLKSVAERAAGRPSLPQSYQSKRQRRRFPSSVQPILTHPPSFCPVPLLQAG